MLDPAIALEVSAIVFALLALFLWPERGLYFRMRRYRRKSERVHCEDALKHIHGCTIEGRTPSLESVAGVTQLSLNDAGRLISQMESKGLIQRRNGDIALSPQGQRYALHVLRTHRLWERYLADRTGYSEAEWHDRAEEIEHDLTPEQTQRLSHELGNPTHDPHGDPIPTAQGEFVPHGGSPLTSARVGRRLRIVHLEDEPSAVYAQLVAQGLHTGMVITVTENSNRRIRFFSEGDEHVLAPILAANVSVVEEIVAVPEESHVRLSEMRPGESGVVALVSSQCRGLERRRFLDLGLLPGTLIRVELRSPSGDPTAYLIRGSTIALRKEQAAWIHVIPDEKAA